jgi:hypothetical protein
MGCCWQLSSVAYSKYQIRCIFSSVLQMLTHAMSLFFPARGATGGEVELLGSCSCGGLIQLATDATRDPPQRQISCSSAQVGACHVGLTKRSIVNPLRGLHVRLLALAVSLIWTGKWLPCVSRSVTQLRVNQIMLHVWIAEGSRVRVIYTQSAQCCSRPSL